MDRILQELQGEDDLLKSLNLSDFNENHKKEPQHLFDIDQTTLIQIKKPKGPKVKGIEIDKLIYKLKQIVTTWTYEKTQKIKESLDHKDPERITWVEFLEWFSNEGRIREKIHNAGLFHSGLTRIVEDIGGIQSQNTNTSSTNNNNQTAEYRLSQRRTEYRVESVQYIEVPGIKKSLNILLCIFENKVAQFFDLKDFSVMHTLSFQAKYKIKDKKRPQSLSQMTKNTQQQQGDSQSSDSIDSQLISEHKNFENYSLSQYQSKIKHENHSPATSVSEESELKSGLLKSKIGLQNSSIQQRFKQNKTRIRFDSTSKIFDSEMNTKQNFENQILKVRKVADGTRNLRIIAGSATNYHRPKLILQENQDQFLQKTPSPDKASALSQSNGNLFQFKMIKSQIAHNENIDQIETTQNKRVKLDKYKSAERKLNINSLIDSRVITSSINKMNLNKTRENIENYRSRRITTKSPKSSTMGDSTNRRNIFRPKMYGILGLTPIDDIQPPSYYAQHNKKLENLQSSQQKLVGITENTFDQATLRQKNSTIMKNIEVQKFSRELRKIQLRSQTRNQNDSLISQKIEDQELVNDSRTHLPQKSIRIAGKPSIGLFGDTLPSNFNLNQTQALTSSSGALSNPKTLQKQSTNMNVRSYLQQMIKKKVSSLARGGLDSETQEEYNVSKKTERLQGKVFNTQSKINDLRYLVSDKVNIEQLKVVQEQKKTAQSQDMQISDKVLVFKNSGSGSQNPNNKKPYLLTAHYHLQSQLLIFSLIDCENKFFYLKQSRKETLIVEEHPKSYFTPFICTSIAVERHKVSKELIACFGGVSQFEIVTIQHEDESEKKNSNQGNIQKEQGGSKFGRVIMRQSMKIGMGPITNIIYNQDSGLIVTTFDGILRNYDSMEFKLVWEHNDSHLNFIEKTTITVCDYSHQLGFICVGGVEGKLQMFDHSAKVKVTQAQKHQSEIIYLYFYDRHFQLISISRDKQINLWDANKLECIQIIRDIQFPSAQYTAGCFASGKIDKIFVVNRLVKVYKMRVNEKVELQVLQTQALINQKGNTDNLIIEEQDKFGFYKQESQIMDQVKLGTKDRFQKTQTQIYQKRQQGGVPGSVLVSDNSQLTSIFIIQEKNLVVTIDSDFMMKSWDLDSGIIDQTLLIKKEKVASQDKSSTIQQSKLEYSALNLADQNQIAISDEDGNITVNNLHSGTILFKLNQAKSHYELSQLQFLNQKSNLYLCATTSQGHVLFFTKPLPSNVFNPKSTGGAASEQYVSQTLIKKNVHQGDLYAITYNETYIAIGGMDNKISYWSAFTGSFKSYTKLPKSEQDLKQQHPLNTLSPNKNHHYFSDNKNSNEDGKEIYIVGLQFLSKHNNVIVAVQNTGNVHICHPASARVLAPFIIKTVTNCFMGINQGIEDIMFCVSDTGVAETFNISEINDQDFGNSKIKLKIENSTKNSKVQQNLMKRFETTITKKKESDKFDIIDDCNSLDRDELYDVDSEITILPLRNNSTNTPKRNQKVTFKNLSDNATQGFANQLEFKSCFRKVNKWQAHHINLRENTQVIKAFVHGGICISGTNHGEVKLWNAEGLLLGWLNNNEDVRWRDFEINRLLNIQSQQKNGYKDHNLFQEQDEEFSD